MFSLLRDINFIGVLQRFYLMYLCSSTFMPLYLYAPSTSKALYIVSQLLGTIKQNSVSIFNSLIA